MFRQYYAAVLFGRIANLTGPSVRPSPCPSVPQGLLTRKGKRGSENNIGVNVSYRARVTGVSAISSKDRTSGDGHITCRHRADMFPVSIVEKFYVSAVNAASLGEKKTKTKQ